MLLVATLLVSGCLFRGSDADPNNGNDGNDVEPREDTGGTGGDDASTPDAGPSDLGPAPDASPDVGAPDAASDAGRDMAGMDTGPDLVADMGTPGPYEIVQIVEASLGGAAATDEPVDIGAMSIGFLVGFSDPAASLVRLGWVSEDVDSVIDQKTFAAATTDVDVVGTDVRGYAHFAIQQEIFGLVLTPNPGGTPPSFDITTTDSITTNGTFLETAVSIESGTVYTIDTRDYLGPILDIGVINDAGLGGATLLEPFEMADLESIGGAGGTNLKRTLVSGISNGQYALVDFRFDRVALQWSSPAYSCGQLPAGSALKRILPFRDLWTLQTYAMGGNVVLTLTECVDTGFPTNRVTVDVPSSGAIRDFDYAAEQITVQPSVMLAWATDTETWVGVLDFDPSAGTAVLSDTWRVPGVVGESVRIAYNQARDTYALAVRRGTSVDVVIFRWRQP